MFRMVVQESRRTPTSGKVIAFIGNYDPHSKQVNIDKEKAGFYLEHGAHPSPRVVSLLKAEKVKLPNWVEDVKSKKRAVRNPDKRRSTTPVSEEAQSEPETTKVEADTSEPTDVAPETEAETSNESTSSEA